MKKATRTIAVIGLATAGLLYLGYRKTKRLKAIFEQMTIRPYGLPRNMKLSNWAREISFDIDFLLENPTGDDFAFTGYVAELKQVSVYYKGQYLGSARVAISELSVPAKDRLILHDVHIVIPTTTLLDDLAELGPQLNNLNAVTVNDLRFTGLIEVLGVNYEIG